MTREKALELAIRACEETWNEKTCKQIRDALEQEPSGDAISREYLFKVLDDFCGHDRTATITLDTLADLVYDMPSVKQEPKAGHWIESNIPNEKYVCSECGGACWYYDYQANVAKSRYCPNCGTKMESEDKECGSQY